MTKMAYDYALIEIKGSGSIFRGFFQSKGEAYKFAQWKLPNRNFVVAKVVGERFKS